MWYAKDGRSSSPTAGPGAVWRRWFHFSKPRRTGMLTQRDSGPDMITATEPSQKLGRLAAVAAPAAGQTVLRNLHSEGPLKAMRVHPLAPPLPAMAFLTISSPGGGVLQGDRLEIDIS